MYATVIVKNKQDLALESPSVLENRLERYLTQKAEDILKELKVYPTMTAPSGYRRTGRLRDEWRWIWSSAGGNRSIRFVNDAQGPKRAKKYATFVQGRRQTIFARRIGWKTAEEIVDKVEIASDVQEIINRYLQRVMR